MKKNIFTGSACAMVTPFKEDGKIDYKRFRQQLDFQLLNGTDAVVISGTTGEGSVLSSREHRQLIKTAVRHVNGKIPVIAGTGSNCTEAAVKRSLVAEDCGADALLIVTPYYNKCSQAGLVEHYAYISDRVHLPIIVYNVPTRTCVNIEPETYLMLSRINHVTAVKEANGDLSAFLKTLSLCGDELDFYCGNDDQSAAFCALGAKGTISVLSNILPAEAHSIASLMLENSNDLSLKLQLQYLPLCRELFCDVNPMPVKYAMKLLGLDNGICRLPLSNLSEKNKTDIELLLKKYELID